jgi:hypothetical protein
MLVSPRSKGDSFVGRHVFLAVVVVLVAIAVRPAAAEVLAVPEAIRHLQAPKEETHVLRSPAGVVLGDQHFHAAVTGDRLAFEITTRFTTGDEWDEHGEMDLADGFRSRRFDKMVRHGGQVVGEQHVDFTNGSVSWLVDGVRAERAMTLPSDTYIGPMLAMVLADVPGKSPAATSFQALVFRPDPLVVTLRADAVDEEDFTYGKTTTSTTKLRVKADLGPVKNVMFASLIPTHYFWFSRETPPAFVAFEGALGNGVEVTMTPETPATTTAQVK